MTSWSPGTLFGKIWVSCGYGFGVLGCFGLRSAQVPSLQVTRPCETEQIACSAKKARSPQQRLSKEKRQQLDTPGVLLRSTNARSGSKQRYTAWSWPLQHACAAGFRNLSYLAPSLSNPPRATSLKSCKVNQPQGHTPIMVKWIHRCYPHDLNNECPTTWGKTIKTVSSFCELQKPTSDSHSNTLAYLINANFDGISCDHGKIQVYRK